MTLAPRASIACLTGLTLSLTLLLGQGCPSFNFNNTPPAEEEQTVTPVDHAKLFTDAQFLGTDSCLVCHAEVGQEVANSLHFQWKGTADGIVGHETHIHGKADLINNFCIAIASNEGRCTECHAGIGWKDGKFDFSVSRVDCLVCHDTSGKYAKDQTTAGAPKPTVDLQAAARSVGTPGRANCGFCHFYAGGGDNVKHGDLASTLVNPTRDMDVHMGGLNYTCQECHKTKDHKIAGAYLHSVASEGRTECIDCHNTENLHKTPVINDHLRSVACQTCHIPFISRALPTIVEWYWKEAGKDISPIPTDIYGKPTYDKKKGQQIWEKNVVPTYMWSNGKTHRYMLDTPTSTADQPVVIARPDGTITDASAKIYPYKKMIGNQPGDAVNKILLVPHLFGTAGGANPYWSKFNWSAALVEGTAAAGQSYSGSYEWVNTVMYLSVNHEIAPKDQALDCKDCHVQTARIDWKALGYADDPWFVGSRKLD